MMQRPAVPPVPTPAAQTQAQIVCSGCRTLLLYPAGAANVRCARCQTITSAVVQQQPAAPQQGDMAQLCCNNAQCRVVLMYPRGAGQVQCSVCGNLNDASQANQLGHVVCGGCQVTLAYAYGAQSVKCAVCSYVTPVASPAQQAMQQQQQQLQRPPRTAAQLEQDYRQMHQQQQAALHAPPQQSAAGSSKQQTVLVENPTSLDESGNEVANIAVGKADKPSDA